MMMNAALSEQTTWFSSQREAKALPRTTPGPTARGGVASAGKTICGNARVTVAGDCAPIPGGAPFRQNLPCREKGEAPGSKQVLADTRASHHQKTIAAER